MYAFSPHPSTPPRIYSFNIANQGEQLLGRKHIITVSQGSSQKFQINSFFAPSS